jgi:3-deoxy-D-manno-octulosonate 8-phosphate phosphatase (KDO 8-P phosphatase)
LDRFAPETVSRARKVRLLLLDVDGVMTDGTLYLDNDGVEAKGFNIMDGLGIKLLRDAGIQVGIVTGRTSEVVARRARELGLNHLVQGCKDKAGAAAEILEREGLDWEVLAYVGDDLIDLGVMDRAGLAVAPPGGAPEARAAAHHVTRAAAGRGAVREVCELILKARDLWDPAVRRYRCD